MAKTITDPKFAQTKAFIELHIEPRIKDIVEQLNIAMGKRGIRVGVELTWFFDEIESSSVNDTEEGKNEDEN
jgi:hypothetical protein